MCTPFAIRGVYFNKNIKTLPLTALRFVGHLPGNFFPSVKEKSWEGFQQNWSSFSEIFLGGVESAENLRNLVK